MPLTVDFSSSQSLSEPSRITFLDNSSGSDGTITQRRVCIQNAQGEYIVEDGTTTNFEEWDYSDDEIELDILDRSTVANVTVEWLNASDVVVYTKTTLIEWNLQDYLFLFELLQTQTSSPTIIQNENFYDNSLNMIVNLVQSESATVLMNDIFSADASLERNQFIQERYLNTF